jgi:protein involved in polysaccharide export with SLBB domain
MLIIRSSYWILLTVLSLGCTTLGGVPAQDIDSLADATTNMMVGDSVKITVFNQPDLSGEFTLDSNGKIWLPLIGGVQASGLSNISLQQKIRAALQPEFLTDPKIVVELISLRPIYLMGEVNRPGTYPYTEDVTVAKAVALAGGFTHRAATGKIKIARQTGDGQLVESYVSLTTMVRGGDLITVSQRFF